jgi:hypothetical protein
MFGISKYYARAAFLHSVATFFVVPMLDAFVLA